MLFIIDVNLRKNLFQGKEILPPLNDFRSGFVMLFQQVPRQQSLRTVVMSDIAGFTEQMGANEPETMARLRIDMDILTSHVTKNDGEIVKIVGDGLLALFSSAPKAVQACLDSQRDLSDSPLKHRIAIHAGEVTVTGGDAYGDAINVCSRVEAMTLPGSVSATKIVIDLVRAQGLPEPFRNGTFQLKGIESRVEIFSWGNSATYRKKGFGKIGVAAMFLPFIVGAGWYANSLRPRDESESNTFSARPQKADSLSENSPVATSAEEALDQAFDEVWQEKVEFDRKREEAIRTLNPQLVMDWIKKNPFGQRLSGRREYEHWSLVKQAMDKGKSIAGKESKLEAIVYALSKEKDPNLDIAKKALIEEYQILK